MQLVSRLQFNLLEVSIIALQESNLRWSTFLKSTGYTCFNVSIFFSPFTFFFFFFFLELPISVLNMWISLELY